MLAVAVCTWVDATAVKVQVVGVGAIVRRRRPIVAVGTTTLEERNGIVYKTRINKIVWKLPQTETYCPYVIIANIPVIIIYLIS